MARAMLLALIAFASLAGCGKDEFSSSASPPPADQSGEDLRGRSFSSTAVTDGGEPRELVAGTRIRVTFAENDDSVGWRAGCNYFGADVEVSDDHLDVGQVAGTQIGCPAELQRQDEWVLDFFDSDPAWALSVQGLTLTSDDNAIELEAN